MKTWIFFFFAILTPGLELFLPKIQIKLKCFIDPSELFNDVKNQLTLELTKHKIVSLNQIICVESDLDHSIIPFLVTELYPNYVLDITDIDLEIDFEECFNFDNPIESLFLYFNS